MNKPILKFEGEYRWLSNFHVAPFSFDGYLYVRTVEHYYQAAKTTDKNWVDKIMASETPAKAKRLGRECPVRSDWDRIKDSIMMQGLKYKFSQNPDLKKKLIETGTSLLVEGNNWNDNYWGYDMKHGYGQNRLGQLLMIVRLWCKDGTL